jgi:hypothetical protein
MIPTQLCGKASGMIDFFIILEHNGSERVNNEIQMGKRNRFSLLYYS